MVDDEHELANLFKEYIIGMGFDAMSLNNPSVALDHFKQIPDRYSMVISDLRMPGMSGLELANKIREINSSVKIFLITAFDIADLRYHPDYTAENIDQILQKPIKLSILKKTIEESLFNQSQIKNHD